MSACRNCNAGLLPGKFFCVRCGEFTISETGNIGAVTEQKTVTLDQVEAASIERIRTGGPWDEVWGGGFVPGSLTLVGGSAGMGKTTMLLQMASQLAARQEKSAYFLSAEQAPGEIKLTADRLQLPNLERFRVMKEFGAGADIDADLLKKDPPAMLVVDSVSALCGKDAHAAVIVSRNMKKLAVTYKCPAFLICHMNKQGDFAGLYTLQHDVDTIVTVFGPESDRVGAGLEKKGYSQAVIEGLRIATCWKNRFGPTGKDHILTMTSYGIMALPDLEKKEPKKKKSGFVQVPDAIEGPRKKANKAPVPETIVLDTQKLVRKPKKKVIELTPDSAVEGEALKKRRAPMSKEVAAKVSKALSKLKKKKVPA